MKAVIWTAYGPPDVLQLQEVSKPIPKDGEVLIKIHAAVVTSGDCEQRSLKLPFLLGFPMRLYVGYKKPKMITILGMDLAGKIELVGKDVKQFKKGDQVFAVTSFENMGTYAEFICLPEVSKEGALVIMPANVTYEEAAGIPTGGIEALNFLRKGNIQSGEEIIINGAGGTIGTFAVQLAKHFGAEVTAVDSTGKLDMLRSIGADRVIDYTKEDIIKKGETYDIILDVAGKSSFSSIIKSLRKKGRYVLANPRPSQVIRGLWASLLGNKKIILGLSKVRVEDLIFLKELIEVGKLKSVIDRSYPLEQIVEAHRYVEKGHKKGNVVVTVVG
jgi:NADPH:quinone reductase-like Zn-dependent oxidoreductase